MVEFNNVYITGDTHRSFSRIEQFCLRINTTKNDLMIILGDAGINYCLDKSDKEFKRYLESLPITFLFIHGNHEARPSTIQSYKLVDWNDGKVFIENDYPSLLFAQDGSNYKINNHNYFVIGGAYSVDKNYRLLTGNKWFSDEQPSDEIKSLVELNLDKINWNCDYILTHTCPLKYQPSYLFLSGINQNEVDNSTEIWLDKIEDKVNYNHWYFGHYHDDNQLAENVSILFKDIICVE